MSKEQGTEDWNKTWNNEQRNRTRNMSMNRSTEQSTEEWGKEQEHWTINKKTFWVVTNAYVGIFKGKIKLILKEAEDISQTGWYHVCLICGQPLLLMKEWYDEHTWNHPVCDLPLWRQDISTRSASLLEVGLQYNEPSNIRRNITVLCEILNKMAVLS